MFRTIPLILALAMVPLATVADAQGRAQSRRDVARAQGVPPGQLPSAGMCRVWYDRLPPGRQPRETNCGQAESMAARDRSARVIYGEDVYGRYGNNRGGVYGNGTRTYPYPYPDNNRGVERSVPGRNRAPNGSNDPYYYPNSSSRYGYGDFAFQNGFRDGREQGQKDGKKNDRFDATRHGRYRSADHGYDDDYGPKAQYKIAYRDGFQAGYNDGYREGNYYR